MRYIVLAALVACGTHNPGHGDGGGPGDGRGADSGSGSGSNQIDIYQSGTRIKMVVLTTPDGAKQFNGWHDTQLNIDCYFGKTLDGVTRCIPSYINSAITSSVFSDAACTTPIAVYNLVYCETPVYVLTAATGGTCAVQPATFSQLGSQYTGPLYAKSGATCTAAIASPAVTYWTVGAAVPDSTFQSATQDIE